MKKAKAPAKRTKPLNNAWTKLGQVAAALFLGLMLGFLSWSVAEYLGQSSSVSNVIGGATALTGAFAGWRWWDKVLDGFLSNLV